MDGIEFLILQLQLVEENILQRLHISLCARISLFRVVTEWLILFLANTSSELLGYNLKTILMQ